MVRTPSPIEPLTSILQEHGFPLSGVVDLDAARTAFSEHASSYSAWIEAGHQGEMDYLRRRMAERFEPHLWYPETKSVLSVARPYTARAQGGGGYRWGRYLKGPDYHDLMKADLQNALEKWASGWPIETRPSWKLGVDSSPIMERTWAALSGLGWIGKNGCLIHPQHGSYLFLGVAYLSIALDQGPKILPDYCGACDRCLRGCPTQAFVKPKVLDARKCISYWTLEERAERELSDQDQKALGTWIAGCDVCQEVCPFNRKAEARDLSPPENLESMLQTSPEEFLRQSRGRAWNRVKPSMLSRNLARANKNLLNKSPQELAWPEEIEASPSANLPADDAANGKVETSPPRPSRRRTP